MVGALLMPGWNRFALLVIPHHQDPQDAADCPFALNNEQPMSWQWLNTVNRVNTQVKKVRLVIRRLSGLD